MKPVHIHSDLLKEIRAKSATDRKEIGERISEVQRCFGQPHLHKGIGLRKLHDDYFEIRIGLKHRLVFENTPTALVYEFLGNHDEIKRFLKAR